MFMLQEGAVLVYNKEKHIKEKEMDVFFEQLVKMKITGKAKALLVLMLALDIVIVAVIGIITWFVDPRLCFLIVVAVIYGSYKLFSKVSVEFEYIFTNGDLDIDRITAKSSRSRVVSIKCATAEKYGEYKGQPAPSSVAQTYRFCNEDSENQMYMIAPNRGEGTVMIIFAPEDRIKEAIEKYIPRTAR